MKKQLIGQIISNKMLKTAVVKTERIKEHPKYKRRYKKHKKYKAHTDSGNFNIGDIVIIRESRPISKDKKWRVVEKVSSVAVKEEKPEEINQTTEEKE